MPERRVTDEDREILEWVAAQRVLGGPTDPESLPAGLRATNEHYERIMVALARQALDSADAGAGYDFGSV